MIAAGYVLTSDAEADVREIVRHTRAAWGTEQVRRYLGKLEQGMERLAAGEVPFREMSAIHPALRMAHCGYHYLFCLPRERAPALIVAVLHERMEIMARLAGRL